MSSKISQLTPDVKGSIVPSLIVELNEVKTLTNVNLKEIYFVHVHSTLIRKQLITKAENCKVTGGSK